MNDTLDRTPQNPNPPITPTTGWSEIRDDGRQRPLASSAELVRLVDRAAVQHVRRARRCVASMTHHLERMPHAATLAKLFDAPCLDLLLPSSVPAATPTIMRGAAPDAPWPKVPEAANVILSHENEEQIYGDIPHRLPRYRHLSGLAESEAGVGPGQPRSGWRVTVHRGLQSSSILRRVHAGQGCAARRRLGRGGWRG